MQINIYKNSKDIEGVAVDHLKVLKGIQGGCWREKIEALAQIQASMTLYSDQSLYPNEKRKLPAVTFSGTFSQRSIQGLINYSQMIILDVDNIAQNDIAMYKKSFEKDPIIHSCFVSPSGLGIKILVKLNSDEGAHLYAFLALEEYFKNTYAIILDKSGKDVSRLCYVSYDPDIIINEDAIPFIFDQTIVPKQVVKSFDNRPERFKNYVISTDAKLCFEICVKWAEKTHQYVQGDRNTFIHVLGCNMNRAGVHIDDAILMAYNNYSELPFKETELAIRSAYKRQFENNTINIHNLDIKNLPIHLEHTGLAFNEQVIYDDTIELLKNGVKPNTVVRLVKSHGLSHLSLSEQVIKEVANRAAGDFKRRNQENLLDHKSIDDSILSILDNYSDSSGVPTTVSEIDEDLQGGLMPSCLYGFVGKGKTFKSILAHWIGAENARSGGLTLYINSEMSALQLMDRVVNKELGLHLLQGLRDKSINEDTLPDIAAKLKEKLQGGFEVVNGSGWDKESIMQTIKDIEEKTGKKVSLIVADGLSQMKDVKNDEIKSAIHNSGQLKEIAKEANSAVIALIHTSSGIVSHLRDTSKHIRGGDKIVANLDAMFCTSLLIDENASDINNNDLIYKKGIFYLRYIDKRSSGNVISKIIQVNHPLDLKILDVDPGALEVKMN